MKKYIIIGLGNFGASLAVKLTENGDEVIAVDKNMNLVDFYKEKITHTICLDATDEYTVNGLPLDDTDVVIVAIGENQGTNIMVTALLKSLKVKKVISRAINPLHEKVLNAIGVDKIVRPEQEAAERWAKKLKMSKVEDSFELNDEYSIIETKVPEELVDKTIEEINFRKKYKLLVITTINKEEREKEGLDTENDKTRVKGIATPDVVLKKEDILVLYGAKKDLNKFMEQ